MNSLGDFLLWSIEVFFLILAIWVFIAIFSDIFRRTDIHGGAKAGWIFLIFILPFLGCLIYIIARPKVTAQDIQTLARADAANKAVSGVSTADELQKLAALKEAGVIDEAQYADLKAKILA
jgi:energy-coupling factor transporter transmembrane protein EcfT